MKSIFLLLLVVSCGSLNSQGITASFKMADTICANSPFTAQNTTAGPVLTHYWEICPSTAGSVSLTPDILPTALASFSNPSSFNIQKDGGSYYMFVTNKATATI